MKNPNEVSRPSGRHLCCPLTRHALAVYRDPAVRLKRLSAVGGRIKIGETAEEAVVREVFEETGVRMRTKRLIAVHENYFYGDMPTNQGKLIYEISFYFEMDVPDDFEPVCDSITEAGEKEFLRWVAPDTPMTIYPEFFRKEAVNPTNGVLFSLTDERE